MLHSYRRQGLENAKLVRKQYTLGIACRPRGAAKDRGRRRWLLSPSVELDLRRAYHGGIFSGINRPIVLRASQPRRLLSSSRDKGNEKSKPSDEPKASQHSERSGLSMESLKRGILKELDDHPELREKLLAREKMLKEKTKLYQEQVEKQRASLSESVQASSEELRRSYESLKDRLKESLGKAQGDLGGKRDEEGEEEGKEAGHRDESESDFVKASKEKFSGAKEKLDQNSFFEKVKVRLSSVRESVGKVTADVFGYQEKDRNVMVKKLKQPGEEDKEKAGGAIMTVRTRAGKVLSSVGKRLNENPAVQELAIAKTAVEKGPVGRGAKRVKEKAHDVAMTIREGYETSQHPIIYQVSGIIDWATAETDIGIGVRDLRRLDPSFDIEDWRMDIQDSFLNGFMSAFLQGDSRSLKEWTNDFCYKKLNADIEQRQKMRRFVDPNVLDIRQSEVLGIRADPDQCSPTIVLQFMCQQINCVRDAEGTVLEGAEDDIRATYYSMAFQREHLEEEAELRWHVVDVQLIASLPYF